MAANEPAASQLAVIMVTIDCEDPQALGQFWSAALGLPIKTDVGIVVSLQRMPGRRGRYSKTPRATFSA